jgi:GT2 family glycosyltransferase
VSRIPRRFQAVTGAALLITAATFESLGGFDEAFPFGYEDVDLCLRAGQLGRSIVCSQAYDSIHLESMSDRRPHRHSTSRKVFFDRWRGRYTFDAGETG